MLAPPITVTWKGEVSSLVWPSVLGKETMICRKSGGAVIDFP